MKGRWWLGFGLPSAVSSLHRPRSLCCTSPSSKPHCCREVPFFEKLVESLERRSWMMPHPGADIHQITLRAPHCPRVEVETGKQQPPQQLFPDRTYSNNTKPLLGERFMEGSGGDPSFYVVRDDLLHPLINGNKARKLDAVLPALQYHSVTDVVTCGGCQSAHTAAVAVSCAERGIRSHLLLRGEQPETLTGYNLVCHMHGNVTYVPRSLYAKREEMLRVHADAVVGDQGSVLLLDEYLDASLSSVECHVSEGDSCFRIDDQFKRVAIINEGAANAMALLGVLRLVHYLSQPHVFGRHNPLKFVIDAGTGLTAIGFGLGIKYLGLPWDVIAVMLADTADTYVNRENKLISEFRRLYGLEYDESVCIQVNNNVHWIERICPRKFGKVLKGEIHSCQQIAQQTGVPLDPIYTLSAWEHASVICQKETDSSKVVMLHTGGTLGLFGLAQRYRAGFIKEDKNSLLFSVKKNVTG